VNRTIVSAFLMATVLVSGWACASRIQPAARSLDPFAAWDIRTTTRIVVEDPNGRILAHGVMPAPTSDYLEVDRDDGFAVVTGFHSPRLEREFLRALNLVLRRAGSSEMSHRELRKAITRRQMTCHETAYTADDRFVGVGLRECINAVVFALVPWRADRPLENQIGFFEPPSRLDGGQIPEVLLAREDPAPAEIPESVTWNDIRHLLAHAMVRLDSNEDSHVESRISICARNMGDLYASNRALATATLRAVASLTREDHDRWQEILKPHLIDDEFPEGFLADPRLPALLRPYLERAGVSVDFAPSGIAARR